MLLNCRNMGSRMANVKSTNAKFEVICVKGTDDRFFKREEHHEIL